MNKYMIGYYKYRDLLLTRLCSDFYNTLFKIESARPEDERHIAMGTMDYWRNRMEELDISEELEVFTD